MKPTYDELVKALEDALEYENERAKHSGLADCCCIGVSRQRERQYEAGTCPHQKARALLALIKESE